MVDTVTCPVCGESNPAGLEFCQNCQSRLRPLPGVGGTSRTSRGRDESPVEDSGNLEEMLPRWLREAREQAGRSSSTVATGAEKAPETGSEDEAADLLAGLEMQAEQPEDETPEWVARIAGKAARTQQQEPLKAKYVELKDEEGREPDQAAIDVGHGQVSEAEPPVRDELGEWFKKAAESTNPKREVGSALPRSSEPPAAKAGREDAPNRVQGLEASSLPKKDAGQGELPLPSHAPPSPTTPELPTWLKNLGAEPPEPQPPSGAESLPSWLSTDGATGQNSGAQKTEAVPDWVTSLQGLNGEAAAPGEAPKAEATSTEAPGVTASARNAESLSSRDLDEIFASMQTPEWLEEATRATAPSTEGVPPAALESAEIAPVELPSWVEAMRPVESEVPPAPPLPVDTRIETGGPLDGLQGVLPGTPGAGAATSKPQPFSGRLDASEQQRAHAELLERLLAAEVTPIPMRTMPLVGQQRGLRWAITAVLIVILGAILLSGSRAFSFPSLVPIESFQAVQTIGAIPAGAPVLVVFDYQPATVGEMEASASSLLDQMLLLQHPQLALISTSPTGAALAERFMSTTLSGRQYQLGSQYVDLGYLAGGLAGIRAFAQNPMATVPLGANAAQVWDSSVLQPVRTLSDFAAIIVLTDSVESGRTWIEQTAGWRRDKPMIIVASAQAGPVLLPYVDSGQVKGLIAGLYGAVGAEQSNGGLPGLVRRYWDAYNAGLYFAAFLMVIGGVWNLWRGMQDRRAEQVNQ